WLLLTMLTWLLPVLVRQARVRRFNSRWMEGAFCSSKRRSFLARNCVESSFRLSALRISSVSALTTRCSQPEAFRSRKRFFIHLEDTVSPCQANGSSLAPGHLVLAVARWTISCSSARRVLE